jgi:hypothetical protein
MALRGTALEYLESVLPPDVRDSLWPQLEGPTKKKVSTRTREEVMAELLRSQPSIEVNLAALRKCHQATTHDES